MVVHKLNFDTKLCRPAVRQCMCNKGVHIASATSFQFSILYKDICIFVHIFVVTENHWQCYFTDGSTIFFARIVCLEGACVCARVCLWGGFG